MRIFIGQLMLWVFFLYSAIPTSSYAANQIAAQYQANLELEPCTMMKMAADFLLSSQKKGLNGTLGWSWELKDDRVAHNTAGLISNALLDAFVVSGDQRYIDAAQSYAKGLLRQKEHWSPYNLPYKADLELLARMFEVTKEASYQKAAREGFSVILERSSNPKSEVQRIAQGRRGSIGLLGFDVALTIRAAMVLGESGYAYGLADEVISRIPRWYRPQKDRRFSLVSAAVLVLALQQLDAGHYRKVINGFQDDLIQYQEKNGAWLFNETQPSAYAVLALIQDPSARARRALEKGMYWIQSTMLKPGAYASYNDYMPEPFVGAVLPQVHAEALLVLSQMCRQVQR